MGRVKLNKSQRKLLRHIVGLCEVSGSCPLSFSDVMLVLACSERTAVRMLGFFRENSYIRLISAGGGRGVTNIYELLSGKGSYVQRRSAEVSESVGIESSREAQ